MSVTHVERAGGATTVLMCGLPASGKTTTAMRLHARLGGVLIRSCDVYQELGIVLPEWVKRTAGFTANVTEYDRVRDSAYGEMARRAETSLAKGSPLIIIDAVHGERAKRRRLYEICCAHRATPILVCCICADFAEVQRRFRAREGQEAEPEREASDLSVFYDIRRRWETPLLDELPDGTRPGMVIYNTLNCSPAGIPGVGDSVLARIQAALAADGEPVPRQNLIRLAQEHRDPSIRSQAQDPEPGWR
jgi:predicted kinase